MNETEDDELVGRVLAGDDAAFGDLVARYQGLIFNLALRMLGNAEDARDVAQTVFMKAWRKLSTFDRGSRFFSWIYRISLNEILNQRRARRTTAPLDEALPATEPGPEQDHESTVRTAAVQEALMELRQADRELVVLHHLLRLSHREIAELHHVPEKTVKSRLFTARQRLEVHLRRRGFGPS